MDASAKARLVRNAALVSGVNLLNGQLIFSLNQAEESELCSILAALPVAEAQRFATLFRNRQIVGV